MPCVHSALALRFYAVSFWCSGNTTHCRTSPGGGVRPGGQLTPPKQEENWMRKIMGEDKDREIAY